MIFIFAPCWKNLNFFKTPKENRSEEKIEKAVVKIMLIFSLIESLLNKYHFHIEIFSCLFHMIWNKKYQTNQQMSRLSYKTVSTVFEIIANGF
jgi:hypothetical protein